jgi:hypothetical protein
LLDERQIELLSGSLDGALSSQEQAELERLLEGSAEARQLRVELAADREELRTLPALTVPASLKQQTLLKARAARPKAGASWSARLMMAASLLLALGLSAYLMPPSRGVLRQRFHLRPGALAMKAAQVSEELRLAAEQAGQPHVLTSQPVSGRYLGGPARLYLHCDAGTTPGGSLLVRLAFDFDGDGEIDLRTEEQKLQVDEQEGYQQLACTWEALNGMRDLEHGMVHVELLNPSQEIPLTVKFDAQLARLELPFEPLQGSDTVTLEVPGGGAPGPPEKG